MAPTAGWTSSTEPLVREPARRIGVGRVTGAHGLRGQIRVRCLGDARDLLLGLTRLTLGRDEDDPESASYEVESAAPGRPDEVRMRLAGFRRREQAEGLRGRLVMVGSERFEALPPGEYWGFQLVGCRVEARGGDAIGTVREVWDTGAQNVLVVVGEGGRERLIPAVRALLHQVDVAGRRIVVEPIPGLLEEPERSGSTGRG